MRRHHLTKAIGLILLLVIMASVDMGEVWHHLRTSDYRYLVPVVLMIFPQVALRALRWQRLLAQQGIRCAFSSAFRFYFAAIYIGLVTPGRLGELAKCLFLKQNGIAGIAQSLPSVLIDRLLDLYFLGLLALGALYHIELFPMAPWVAAALAAVLGVLPWPLLRWAQAGGRSFSGIGKWLSRVSPRWEASWYALVDGSRVLLSPRLVESLILTIASYAVYFGQIYLIGQATGMALGWGNLAMIMAVAILIGYIPITVAGLGTREATLIYLFGHFNISAAGALGFAFLYNLVYIICVGVISAVFWIKLPNRQTKTHTFEDPE